MFLKTIRKFFKAFCYNLIQEQITPVKGYRVYFGQRRSRLKIEAITNVSRDEFGNIKIERQFFTWGARYEWYKYCLKQFFIIQPIQVFKQNPAMAYILLLAVIYPKLFPFVAVIGAIAYDAASGSAGVGTSLTWAHTCSGSNRVLIVGVGLGGVHTNISGVTYNTVGLTKQIAINNGNSDGSSSEWSLVAPATGANNIVVSMSSSWISAGAVSFSGAHQTSPIDGTGSYAALTTTPSVNITTSHNNTIIVDSLQWSTADTTRTPGTSQTERWFQQNAANGKSAGSTKPMATAGATTMSWTITNAYTAFTALGVREGEIIYYKTLSAVEVSSVVLSKIRPFSQTLSIIEQSIVNLITAKIKSQVISAIENSIITLGKYKTIIQTITVTMTSVPVISLAKSFYRTLSAIGISVPIISFSKTILKILSATVIAIARIIIPSTLRNALLKAYSVFPKGTSKTVNPGGKAKIDKAN